MACDAGWRVCAVLLLLVSWGGHEVMGKLQVSCCHASKLGCPQHHLHCDSGATVFVQAAKRVFNVTESFCVNHSFICQHNCCKNITHPVCRPAVDEDVLTAIVQSCSGRHDCSVEINPEHLHCGLNNNRMNVLQSYDSRIVYNCTPGSSLETEDDATISSMEITIGMEGTVTSSEDRATESSGGDDPKAENQGYIPLIVGGAVAGGTTLLLMCAILVCWRKRRASKRKPPEDEGIAVVNPAYEEGGGLVDSGLPEDADCEYDVLRSKKVRQPAQPEGLYGHLGAAADQSEDGVYDVTGNRKESHVVDNVYDHAVNVRSVIDAACDVYTNATEVKDADLENARDLDEKVTKDDVIESAQDDVTEHVYELQ